MKPAGNLGAWGIWELLLQASGQPRFSEELSKYSQRFIKEVMLSRVCLLFPFRAWSLHGFFLSFLWRKCLQLCQPLGGK